jgi:hypothetical protein
MVNRLSASMSRREASRTVRICTRPAGNVISQLGWDTAGAFVVPVFRDRTAHKPLSLVNFVHVQYVLRIAYPTAQAAHAFGDLLTRSATGQSRNSPVGRHRLEAVDTKVWIVWLSSSSRLRVQAAFNFTGIIEAISRLG